MTNAAGRRLMGDRGADRVGMGPGEGRRDGRIAEVTSFIGAEHVALLGPPATAGS